MSIGVLRDYCETLTDEDADRLLCCWALWVKTAEEHLGYKSPSYAISNKSNSSCIWLNDDELEMIDKAVGKVREHSLELFNSLVWRYVKRNTLRQMAKALKVKSTNAVYTCLARATEDFKRNIKELVC